MVLGQLPPNRKTNSNPTPNLNRGPIFSEAIVWFLPNPKTNPNLDPNPNYNQGAIFLGG